MTDDLIPSGNDIAKTANTERAIQEIQAQIIVAKKYPRDINEATINVMEACKRKSLAEKAMYTYPKGGKTVTGPTIRLLEVIQIFWKNLKSGVEEISTTPKETKYRAFAWDMENNNLVEIQFTQVHSRWANSKLKDISGGDPRDIYELVMSMAKRRKRACLMEVIPPYIIEEAVNACYATLEKGYKDVPMIDRIRKTVKAFKEIGVTEAMIVKRLGHKMSSVNNAELVDLHNTYMSLKDNMGKIADFFEYEDVKKEKLNKDYESKKEEPETMAFPYAITEIVNCKTKSSLHNFYEKVMNESWTDKEMKDLEKTFNQKDSYLEKEGKK